MASASSQRRLVIIFCSFVFVQLLLSILEMKLLNKSDEKTIIVRKVLEPSDRKPMIDGYNINWFYKSEGIRSEEIFSDNDVTIAVHMTVDHLYKIIDVAANWKGPISLAVFAPGEDIARLDDAIDGLRMCWQEIRTHVKFHVVTLTPSGEDYMKNSGSFIYLGCKDILRRIKRFETSYDVTKSTYPHNLMRNVALRGVLTDHLISLDSGITPPAGLMHQLNMLVKNETDEKTAFVLPVFETKNEIKNLGELLEDYSSGNVQPYLYETCRGCHKPTDYEKWLRLSVEKRIVTYEVSKAKVWEPFFVVSRKAPDYDELMRNYGFDRTSYVCLLRSQGYKFKVVVGSYLSVRGFRSRISAKPIHIRRMRDEEKFYDSFYNVLKSRLKQNLKHIC